LGIYNTALHDIGKTSIGNKNRRSNSDTLNGIRRPTSETVEEEYEGGSGDN
jgi:hypothetical protein